MITTDDIITSTNTKPGSYEAYANYKTLEEGVYYHAIGVFDTEHGKNILYMDGENVAEASFTPGWHMQLPTYVNGTWVSYNKNDALAQWLAIGGDSRKSDHPTTPGKHVNDGWDNNAERVFTGEIVVVRLYGKALTAAEAKVLYNYEKPE
jgi:hypothetical protein